MANYKTLLLSALIAQAFVSAADNAEIQVLINDINSNQQQYLSLIAGGEVTVPADILGLYGAIQTATDSAYTTLFSQLDQSEVNSLVTALPWYSSRLEPQLAALEASSGAASSTEDASSHAAVSSSAVSSSQADSSRAAVSSSRAVSSSHAASSSNAASSHIVSNSTITAASHSSSHSSSVRSSSHSDIASSNSTHSNSTSSNTSKSNNGANPVGVSFGAGLAAVAAMLI